MTKYHSITIDFHEKLVLQKIYGETECRCLSFEDETDLLAKMILLIVGHDEEKIKLFIDFIIEYNYNYIVKQYWVRGLYPGGKFLMVGPPSGYNPRRFLF